MQDSGDEDDGGVAAALVEEAAAAQRCQAANQIKLNHQEARHVAEMIILAPSLLGN